MNRHRSILFVILPFLLLPAVAEAQYFGQNRVRYRSFDFLIVETAHFDVYYYDDFRDAAMDAARMAERAYARLARTLHHEYRERQPIVLFASHTEFQQNNLIDISEGVQGVTDAIRHRVMLPFTGSYEDFDHVLQHELVHQFQFDIFARGRIGAAVERMMFIQPPLWFTEGIAEYLSIGPVNALTAMWLRDAALNETLPTIEQLTTDSRIFPYRYGHALFAYIAERWGDEAVGEIMHGVASSGIGGGFGRALRISLDQLSKDWHDAVRSVYFAKDVSSEHPLDAAIPVLTRERSKGGLHISPVLSPDGSQIVYFSDGGSLFIDLYLADVASGRIDRRLVRSAFSAEMESLRFLNSAGAWSPDGRFLAFPAKNGGRDDLIIFDTVHNRIHRRINIPLSGITNPAWSPYGNQLVFTGLSGGHSDLFVVDVDGTDLQQLTNDRYSALHPAWSPDGQAIAFVTDRGPQADLDNLRTGPLAIALFHVDTDVIDVLPGMEGSNINPQWSPDGTGLAFVSDRTGVANLFIHEIQEGETYQL
ncbi:MAG: PD40 domain-containing protein, partial [Gemmatimonadetes bacterium]|nr:PD40 domain-containing protein [Gemmatimonadota bacterium]